MIGWCTMSWLFACVSRLHSTQILDRLWFNSSPRYICAVIKLFEFAFNEFKLTGCCLEDFIIKLDSSVWLTMLVFLYQTQETLSTCRFAQRVAMITNEIAPNEEIDSTALIQRLNNEIESLKVQLALTQGEKVHNTHAELPADEKML